MPVHCGRRYNLVMATGFTAPGVMGSKYYVKILAENRSNEMLSVIYLHSRVGSGNLVLGHSVPHV